ncbi:hypothetical protein ACFX2A_017052 [Malus domestica]
MTMQTSADFSYTALESASRNGNRLAIEPHPILVKGGTDRDSGGGAKVRRIKSQANSVIDRQDELLVPLPPVLDHCDIGGRLSHHHQHPFLQPVGH